MPNFKAGQFIRFTYNRPPEAIDKASGSRHKEVFVLNPSWLGEMHGIDLMRLTVAEREVLAVIFDPRKAHRIGNKVQLQDVSPGIAPLVNDILRRMEPRQEITNPMAFYQKFVKPFLRGKDAYRKYKPSQMMAITVSRRSTVLGKVTNPKPLFHKVETKPQGTPFKPTSPGSEHGKGRRLSPDEIAAMAKKMGVSVAKPKLAQPAPQTKLPLTKADKIAAMKAYQAKKGKK